MIRFSTSTRLLAFSALLSGCSQCGEDAPAPVVPTVDDGSGFGAATQAADEGSADPAPAPERPVIVYEAPTANDLAVTPIEGDWTHFRGDARRSGVRDVRPIRDPEIAWSREIGIQGYANNIVVTDDTLYVASQGDRHQVGDERDGLYALDAATGAINWHFSTEKDANGVALIGDVLLVGTDNRTLHAVNPANGTERWSFAQECQFYHAPEVRDGTIYVLQRNDQKYLTIDIETGAVEGEPNCSRSDRGTLSVSEERIFVNSTRGLAVIDELGVAWEDEPVVEDRRARGRWAPPLFTDSLYIFGVSRWPFGNEDGVRYRPAAVARWQDNGQVAWVADINDPAHAHPEPSTDDTAFLRSAPWVLGQRLYWTSTNAPTMVAFDVLTGERVDSLTFPDCRSRAFGSIVGTPEMGYYARHDGMLYGFNPEPMSIAWQLSIGLHGAVGRSNTHMPTTPPCNAEPKDGTALFATPSIGADGTVYVGTGDGWIYAIKDAAW